MAISPLKKNEHSDELQRDVVNQQFQKGRARKAFWRREFGRHFELVLLEGINSKTTRAAGRDCCIFRIGGNRGM